MSFLGFLAPPERPRTRLPGTMELEELNARAHPEFKTATDANGTTKLFSTSPVEDLNHEKRRLQDLELSHRKANIPKNGYGLIEKEMKTYTKSPDKFENILAAHAAPGNIPYVIDLKISLSKYAKLIEACNSIYGKLPVGDSHLASLECLMFLERWIRLQAPVFSKTEKNATIDRWNEKIKEQDFALRESPQWGLLYKLYEQWVIDKTNFYEPQHDSLDDPDFDSD
ncbi:hypothetical protein BOTNAR_0009g00050 [Botryotinia narcissicola]|uniref:Uncharacterized protein n=1 Tax=Botryotinia narcissicola TaxID=278944 RepID=A0A4Z1J7K0_9HELO|nr:hypothetical protein BOTNAR_0009g00050 [Botryotinia narcissicola]